jgi:hypothetical protein
LGIKSNDNDRGGDGRRDAKGKKKPFHGKKPKWSKDRKTVAKQGDGNKKFNARPKRNGSNNFKKKKAA